MITPKMCCDTKFPLINFAQTHLGLHLKLTITDKLFIFDRNHSLHCGKQTTLRSRRPGFRANKASNIDKLTFFLTVQDRIAENRFQSEIKPKEAISVQMQHGLFYLFISSFRSKVQNPKLSISALIGTPNFFHHQKVPTFPHQRDVLQG